MLNMYWLIGYLADGTQTKKKYGFAVGGTLQYRTTDDVCFFKICE
jgi:hypothetical protein